MDLQDFQRRFGASLRGEDSSHSLPIAGDGLRIYRNNYREQLRSALRFSFPYLLLWLGDAEFDRLAVVHIQNSAPRSWTLDHYGDDFPATARRLFPDDPEVPELAWLDWAMGEALVAPDQPPLDWSALAELDWDRARIGFVAALRQSEASSNAADIWCALEEESEPPPAAPLAERRAVVVWRRGLTPCFRQVPFWEYQMISALRDGFTFGGACELLALQLGVERATEAAGQMLARWLGDGLIAKVGAKLAGAAPKPGDLSDG